MPSKELMIKYLEHSYRSRHDRQAAGYLDNQSEPGVETVINLKGGPSDLETTRAITKRDHTPQQLLVTKQINVTGMQNKRQKRA